MSHFRHLPTGFCYFPQLEISSITQRNPKSNTFRNFVCDQQNLATILLFSLKNKTAPWKHSLILPYFSAIDTSEQNDTLQQCHSI